jgi:hypothetical protein
MEIILFGFPVIMTLGIAAALGIYIKIHQVRIYADEKSISEREIEQVKNYWKTHPAKPGIEVYPPLDPEPSLLNANCTKQFGEAMTAWSGFWFDIIRAIAASTAVISVFQAFLARTLSAWLYAALFSSIALSMFWTRIRVKILRQHLVMTDFMCGSRELNKDDLDRVDGRFIVAYFVINILMGIVNS